MAPSSTSVGIVLFLLFLYMGLMVFLVFYIIRVWKMITDVRKIRASLTSPRPQDEKDEIRKCLLIGDIKRGKEIVIGAFVEKVHKCENDPQFVNLKTLTIKRLQRIGSDVPELLDSMNCLDDYRNMLR